MPQVDNTIYDHYGDRWYTAYDDPVALLRAENRVKTPWILKVIRQLRPETRTILDVGCGAGFLSNELAKEKFTVTGVDLSGESLKVAARFDETKSVCYLVANAESLPFPDASFDVVTAMDFLEHVEDPERIIHEISRVLKPEGLFFFHTFNRNFLSWLVVIKFVEWFVANTPKNMHVLRLFIKPKELDGYCRNSGMKVVEWSGIRPLFGTISFKNLLSGIVPEGLKFTLTSSLLLSYLGVARKEEGGAVKRVHRPKSHFFFSPPRLSISALTFNPPSPKEKRMKLVSTLVAFCFAANVFASTGTASALQQTFDNYQYSMSVEWDQKDKAAQNAINEKFFNELSVLVKEQGLSQAEVQAFAESKIADKTALEAMKLKLSLLTDVKSSKDLARVLSESSKDFYSKGASWNGDVALYVGVGVLIAALIGYSVWFHATHECVAWAERWECYTSGGSYDYYYDYGYVWDRTYYTSCGWVDYCTQYEKKD